MRPLQSLRILIIERNACVRTLLVAYVTAWGMQATEVPAFRLGLDLGARRKIISISSRSKPAFSPAMIRLRSPDNSDPLPAIPICFDFFLRRSVRVPNLPGNTQAVPKPIKPLLLRNAVLQALGTGRLEIRREARVSKLDNSMAVRLPIARFCSPTTTPSTRKVASRLLQQMGYKADIASNGLEVLQALERKPYDVHSYGCADAGEWMASRPPANSASTAGNSHPAPLRPAAHDHRHDANAMHGDREKCIASGMNSYVSKPMRPEALQAALEQLHLLTPRQRCPEFRNEP